MAAMPVLTSSEIEVTTIRTVQMRIIPFVPKPKVHLCRGLNLEARAS